MRNSCDLLYAALQNGPVTLTTPHESYLVRLDESNVMVEATRIHHASCLKGPYLRITHRHNSDTRFRNTSLSVRAAQIEKCIKDCYEISCADTLRARISYPGKNKNDVPGFQQSDDFSQFTKEYTTAVRKLSCFVEDTDNVFGRFLDRVFPPSGQPLNENPGEARHLAHQFYLLKGFFEASLKIMQDAKAHLGKGATSEENQQRQESFYFKTGALNGLLEALQKCSDGLLTQSGDVLLKLNADDLDTLYSRVEKGVRGLIDDIISRMMTKYYNTGFWDTEESVHLAAAFRKVLGLPTLGDDRYSRTILPEHITEAINALRDGLKVRAVLARSGVVKKLFNSLPRFDSSEDKSQLELALKDEDKKEDLIQRRYQCTREILDIAEQQSCYQTDAASHTSASRLPGIDKLYLVDEDGLILGLHPDAALRVEVSFVHDIVEKLTRIHAQGVWAPPLNWQKVAITRTDEGTVWQVGDLFWHESPDGDIFQPGVQDLLHRFNDIDEKQCFTILDRAVQQGTKSLSQLNWPDKIVVQQDSDGTIVWQVGDFFSEELPHGYCWRESPDGRVFQLKMADLLRHIDDISVRQRFSIIAQATEKEALLLCQLEPRYLPEDSRKVAIFLSKMSGDRTGIDYVIQHADWFKKCLPTFDHNPLAESILRLNTTDLATLPSWMFDRMDSKQTDRLIKLLTPVWFPGDSHQVDVMKIITLPEKIQNRIASYIVQCLKTTGRQKFHALSLEDLLNFSPQVLQRGEMADVIADYFRAYVSTGTDIATASLLQLPEHLDVELFILLREIPIHKIFTAEVGEKLWTDLLQKKQRIHQDVLAYLNAHPNYLRELGLHGIAVLPQGLREVISRQISLYIRGNIAAVRASILSTLQKDREQKSALTLDMIKMLPPDVWQSVVRGIAPHRLFICDHNVGSTPFSSCIRNTFDHTGGTGSFENYLKRYFVEHRDYLHGLGMDGIVQLPHSVREIITPQISAFLRQNVSAVRTFLLATMESEIASIPSRNENYPVLEDDSPTLKVLKVLTADTWLTVLQQIPPDKFSPLFKTKISSVEWSDYFSAIMDNKGKSAANAIKQYMHTYVAAQRNYLNELGLDGIAALPWKMRKTIRPQISTYIKENISAVQASLLATIESETASVNQHHLNSDDDSPVLKKLRLLTTDTWLAVLQEIPPDKFFPFSSVMTGFYSWNQSFLQTLENVDNSDSDVIKKYVDAYLTTHQNYIREHGKSSIPEASAHIQAMLR